MAIKGKWMAYKEKEHLEQLRMKEKIQPDGFASNVNQRDAEMRNTPIKTARE